MAASSKVWVCSRSLFGIAGSNSAEGVNDTLLRTLRVFQQRSLQRADHRSREVIPSRVCLIVILKPQQLKALAHQGLSFRKEIETQRLTAIVVASCHCDGRGRERLDLAVR